MSRLVWDADAESAIRRAPFFVRPLARRKIEQMVRDRGRSRVHRDDVEEAHAKFRAVAGDKSEAELALVVPQPNQAGAEMVVVEQCQSELSNCPNQIISSSEWKRAVEDWAQRRGLSEELRQRIGDDQILFHHKLRISISGCPNGCSRPQIAAFGVVGTARPEFDPELCIGCSACEAACPDRAITVDDTVIHHPDRCLGCSKCHKACPTDCIALGAARATVMAGGKLGRHPHLAEPIATVDSPAALVALLDREIDDYLAHADFGDSYSEYWIKTHTQL